MFLKTRLHQMLAFALVAAPVAAFADPVYSVNFLPNGFQAHALGENGIVGGMITTGTPNVWAGATYSNGSLTRYDNLGISNITAINSNGMFTGSLRISSTMAHAFIYRDGVVQDISQPGTGLSSSGDAINASGQVAFTAFNGPYGDTYLYSNGSSTRLAPTPPYYKTWIEDMNDSGVVIGGTELQAHDYAFMYSNGVMTELRAPDGGGSWAYGINNSGSIVGYLSQLSDSTARHAFLYRDGAMEDLGTFGGVRAAAYGINDSGSVVGYVSMGDSGYAFLYRDGRAVNLNTLVSGADGWTITAGKAINESGQILAYACAAGSCRDVLLDPISAVPEPATYAMLLAGLAAFVTRRRFPIRK